MNPPGPLEIRSENANLAGHIRDLLRAAFPTADEAQVVDDLRAANALPVSLVAVESGRVVGHIAFSPASILPPPPKPCPIWALAPLAVAPDVQRRGIGSALVNAGLQACSDCGCDAVVALGDPAYYRRFGFMPAAELGLRCLFDAPTEAFMIREVRPGTVPMMNGTVHFHVAFDRFLGPNAAVR